jgi:hypothetical protein
MILYKIENSKSRQLFKCQKIDFCSAIEKGSGRGSSPMVKVALRALKNSLRKLKCPWNGITLQNVTLDRKLIEMFPSGMYKAIVDMDLYSDSNEKDLLKFNLVFVIE